MFNILILIVQIKLGLKLFVIFFKFAAIDYNITRGSNPVKDPIFNIVQVSGFDRILPESTSTTTPGPAATTESTNNSTSCDQDIVCICLDVSGSMDVSVVEKAFWFWFYDLM